MTRRILIGVGVVAIVAVGGGVVWLRGAVSAVGDALASAPAAEPLPFTVVELRANTFAEARRGRALLASVGEVGPFTMAEGVMSLTLEVPPATLRAALPDLVTDQGERFVVDAEDGRTATIQLHLAR